MSEGDLELLTLLTGAVGLPGQRFEPAPQACWVVSSLPTEIHQACVLFVLEGKDSFLHTYILTLLWSCAF